MDFFEKKSPPPPPKKKVKFILFARFLHKFYLWEEPVSWDMDQNALDQSDWRILILNISLEQNDKITWFYVCW